MIQIYCDAILLCAPTLQENKVLLCSFFLKGSQLRHLLPSRQNLYCLFLRLTFILIVKQESICQRSLKTKCFHQWISSQTTTKTKTMVSKWQRQKYHCQTATETKPIQNSNWDNINIKQQQRQWLYQTTTERFLKCDKDEMV